MKKRNILLNGVLTFFTFGLWGLVWLAQITNEVQTMSGRQKTAGGKLAAFFSFITCGFYTFYWLFKTSGEIGELRKSRGLLPDAVSKRSYIISFVAVGIGSLIIDAVIIYFLFATTAFLGDESVYTTADLMAMFCNFDYVIGEIVKLAIFVICLTIVALKTDSASSSRILHVCIAIVLFLTYWLPILTIAYLQASTNDLIDNYNGSY